DGGDVKWILRLYPPAWRRRYGDELEALLEDIGPSPAVIADALIGAVDARLGRVVEREPERSTPAEAPTVTRLSPVLPRIAASLGRPQRTDPEVWEGWMDRI